MHWLILPALVVVAVAAPAILARLIVRRLARGLNPAPRPSPEPFLTARPKTPTGEGAGGSGAT